MKSVEGKITLTAQDYAHAGQASRKAVSKIYPSAISHFPDIGDLHLPQIGNFTDQPVSLKEPQSAEQDTADSIQRDLELLRRKVIFGGPLSIAQKVFQALTGQSLVELLIDPLADDYGRLL